MLDEFEDIPEDDAERALYLQNLMIAYSTDGTADGAEYKALRRYFMQKEETASLVPKFVRTCRDLSAFWGWIKPVSPTYAGRRSLIRTEFAPLLDYLEGTNRAPLDVQTSETLASFDAEGVHAAWEKALARREADPEGAITSARTLLETVCKHILDEQGLAYETDDLPALYAKTSKALNIAPSQHSEEAFKRILGGATSVVEGLGALRNRISDAHGRGKNAVRPAPRHARLAVNMAGTAATFLIETWIARESSNN